MKKMYTYVNPSIAKVGARGINHTNVLPDFFSSLFHMIMYKSFIKFD